VKSDRSPHTLRRYAAYVIGGGVTFLLLAAAIIEWRYGLLIPTLRSPVPFAAGRAGGFVVVDPSRITALAPDLFEPAAGRLPRWLVSRLLPYEAGGAAILDMDGRRVALTGYLNARRLAPLIKREAAKTELQRHMPEIHWAGRAHETRPGMLVAQGAIPFDPDAEQSFGYMWDASLSPAPLSAEGGHFIEAVFDNRRGHSYLIFASFLRAYNIDLAENQHEISLSSLQFVREARFTADFAAPDAFRMRLVLDIVPEAIERLGVVNLKVGIEESLSDLAQRWREDFGLELRGEARWEANQIIYEYQLKSARKVLRLARDGKLK
jgi:hypothetical protein